jgi:hypothetical protein
MPSPFFVQVVKELAPFAGQKAESVLQRQLQSAGKSSDTFSKADLQPLIGSLTMVLSLYLADPDNSAELRAKLESLAK